MLMVIVKENDRGVRASNNGDDLFKGNNYSIHGHLFISAINCSLIAEKWYVEHLKVLEKVKFITRL